MHGHIRGVGLFVIATVLASAYVAGAQSSSQILQTKFEQEYDVIRRAKMMTKLSRADFHEISQQVADGDNTDALKILAQLVDDAQKCSDTLDAREKNPESHPNGFKQLQIATRESLQRLDDLNVGLTHDEQTPFLAIRKKLDLLNRHLIHELFPHQALPNHPADPPAESDPGPPEVTK